MTAMGAIRSFGGSGRNFGKPPTADVRPDLGQWLLSTHPGRWDRALDEMQTS
jgi:hypothetical protein